MGAVMSQPILRRLGCLLTLIVGAASAAQAPARVLPGWLGVFPEVGMYSRRLEVPKSEKESWQQSARYEWSGGRSEMIRVTLMRDAAEAKKYAFDAKNPLPDTVKKVKVAERDAYEYPGGKLVIDLGKDRRMLLEAPTWQMYKSNLAEFAKRFSLDACAKAIEKPPRTDFTRKLDAFRELKKGMSLAEVRERVGDNEKDVGSGIHILEYRLDDGSRVLIGFPDLNRLIYVKHEDKAGKVVDLAK
jgi:hypothetical protein